MKKPIQYPEEDKKFLSAPAKWPIDECGYQYCALKSSPELRAPNGMPEHFGIVFSKEPLTVHFRSSKTTKKYETLDALLKDWMVD